MPTGSPLKDILKTSLPAVVDLSSQTIMWTFEAILIGQISAAAFAGVGMAIQIIILFFTVILTFVVGSSVIINRYMGANNYWEANHILGQALMIGIVISFIIGLTWYFGGALLFKIIREKGKNRLYAVGYKGESVVILKITFSLQPLKTTRWEQL